MPFVKNDPRVNRDGRPAGATNKLTKELRTLLKDLMFTEISKIPEILENLEPKDRLELLIKLMPYVLPKIETVDAKANEPLGSADFNEF